MGPAPIKDAKEKLLAMLAFIKAWVAMNADLEPTSGLDPVTRARNASTVIAVVVIGIVALVGILIFGEVWNAMPMQSGDPLYNESENILTGFGDAMNLVPIILLVLLASVVIAVVNRMRA